jgi:hypothetical protein
MSSGTCHLLNPLRTLGFVIVKHSYGTHASLAPPCTSLAPLPKTQGCADVRAAAAAVNPAWMLTGHNAAVSMPATCGKEQGVRLLGAISVPT